MEVLLSIKRMVSLNLIMNEHLNIENIWLWFLQAVNVMQRNLCLVLLMHDKNELIYLFIRRHDIFVFLTCIYGVKAKELCSNIEAIQIVRATIMTSPPKRRENSTNICCLL